MKINRNGIVVGIGVSILSVCIVLLLQHTPSIHQTYTVILTKDGFEPSELSIAKGDSVVFSSDRGYAFWPASDSHPAHAKYPAFDAHQPIDKNAQWEFQFMQSGAWAFHDHLNSTLRGTINVTQ
jgi:plastocyanin